METNPRHKPHGTLPQRRLWLDNRTNQWTNLIAASQMLVWWLWNKSFIMEEKKTTCFLLLILCG